MTDRSTTRVLLVGLGTIARTHLAVLARRDDVEVVGGVDPALPDGHAFPVHPDLDAALAATDPDLVVVATPTATHVDLVTALLGRTTAHVLSEKPLAQSRAEIDALPTTDRLAVAHHFAFSPEVTWARRVVRATPGLGRPTRIVSVFNDAYGHMPPAQQASYVSTFVDSAPNQLSLLAPFAGGWSVRSHDDARVRAMTVLDHDGGTTVLTSNWLAGDTSKQTTVEYDGGAVVLRMDHTSMTGVLLRDGVPVEHAGYTGTDSRKDAHYRGLYDALLGDPDDERLGLPLAAEIAEVLEAAGAAPPSGADWTVTSA